MDGKRQHSTVDIADGGVQHCRFEEEQDSIDQGDVCAAPQYVKNGTAILVMAVFFQKILDWL